MHTRHIVFLYTDTGGGHRATAQAVEKAIKAEYGDRYSTEVVNAIASLPYPYDHAESAYPTAISRVRAGYELFWNATNNSLSADATRTYLEQVGRQRAQEFLHAHPADVYVSCHPLLNQSIPGALEHLKMRTPVIGVVSDLVTVHAWFWSPKVSRYTVPTPEAQARAIANGVAPERIVVTGQPVSPDFAARVRDGRAQKDAAAGRATVLLMGGGDGMGRLGETVQALAQSELDAQLVVVCGRNEALREQLSNLQARMPMRVLGFCDNIPELMGGADVLVTKAGPGSICEGFIAGLPIVLYDAVPGQEAGNIELVTGSGAGAWRPSPNGVLEQLREWFAEPARLSQSAAVSLAQARPDSALNIARVIDESAR